VNDDDLLAEQRSYYRARAPEYDEWWQRRGRFDRGEEQLLEWQRQVAVVDDALASFSAKARSWNWRRELVGGLSVSHGQPTVSPLWTVPLRFSHSTRNGWDVRCQLCRRRISSIGKPTPAMTWCSSPSGSRTYQGPDLASSGRSFTHASLPRAGRSSSTIETIQCQKRLRRIHSSSNTTLTFTCVVLATDPSTGS
jgi:hypothetical protein